MTDTAPRGEATRDEIPTPLVRVAFPAPAPASAAAASVLAGVALVTLDRPAALNALSFDLLDQLVDMLEALDRDPACRAIVIVGSGTRAFAAGADIRELEPQTAASLAAGGRFGTWDRGVDCEFRGAAVVRFALGQYRGRRYREEGRCDRDQHAVESSTVRQTITHRHTPLGEAAPAWNGSRYRPHSFG